MSLEEQLWTLNPYVIKRIPLYILSMPKKYFNELLKHTRINILPNMNNIELERPFSFYNEEKVYRYMGWNFFVSLMQSEQLKENWKDGNLYEVLKYKYRFNDEIIQRVKYYMLLLFLSAWKRTPEWVDGNLVEAWKMEVMQDIVNENLKITPYGKDEIYNRDKLVQIDKEDIAKIILDANLNSVNVGVNQTTGHATYDTFISQKYRILSQKRNRILGDALIKHNMLVAPSMNMQNFWKDYNYIIPILFLSKEKKHFRLLNYTTELFDEIK